MFRSTSALLAALLVAGAVHAQSPTPPADAGKGPGKPHAARDCSKASDPKACEDRHAKLRAARDEARKACEGKAGPERHECMAKSMCAKAPDPAKCEARARERAKRLTEHKGHHERAPGAPATEPRKP